jgi:hypothetical protein
VAVSRRMRVRGEVEGPGRRDGRTSTRRHSTNGLLSPIDYERLQAHGPGAHPEAAA